MVLWSLRVQPPAYDVFMVAVYQARKRLPLLCGRGPLVQRPTGEVAQTKMFKPIDKNRPFTHSDMVVAISVHLVVRGTRLPRLPRQ